MRVLRAGTAACPKIEKDSQRHVYPAPYIATTYDTEGPYWEWPIRRNGRIWNKCTCIKSVRTRVFEMLTTLNSQPQQVTHHIDQKLHRCWCRNPQQMGLQLQTMRTSVVLMNQIDAGRLEWEHVFEATIC
ncbi:hypothetical protein Golomagni_04945 [Golovinomyces magnicellulatus]|nr:hypothetical protein Golomagni_04945 [Golovinomyces magnicellulatus]